MAKAAVEEAEWLCCMDPSSGVLDWRRVGRSSFL